LRRHDDAHHPGFSPLVESTFDEAAGRFADQEIDLLHLDGYYTYETVARDFETWRRKVSERGVVLFHDVADHLVDFGVSRLWAELSATYPSFAFEHEGGLGVLVLGGDAPDDVRALVDLRGEEAVRVRAAFSRLGRSLRSIVTLENTRAERDRALQDWASAEAACEIQRQAMVKINADRAAMRRVVASGALLQSRLEKLQAHYHRQLTDLTESIPYRTGARVVRLAARAVPAGSRRRKFAAQLLRLARAIAREGVIALARRKGALAADRIAERSTIRRYAREPWRPDGRPVFLLVSHHAGGGTERHVRDLGALLESEAMRPVLVRPGPSGSLVWEEKTRGGTVTWCRTSAPDRESLRQVLDLLDPVHAHVHHLAGLPDTIVDLLRDRGIPYDWTIHDYHAICPRIHLIGVRGVYCGEPAPAACNACLSRLGDDRGHRVSDSITVWRRRFRRHLIGARRVFAPSEDAARRIARHMPRVRLEIRPHFEDLQSPAPLARQLAPGEPVRVLVVGTIVAAKGSQRLLSCAGDAHVRGLPLEFHVIGSTDQSAAFARLKNVRVTGPYRDSDVFERVAAARCHLAFLPTVCPETFMYTLSIVMAAGFYTVCYDLGAQAERLRAWGWGQALPLDTEPHAVNDAILDDARRLAAEPTAPPPPVPASYPHALTSYYGFTALELSDMRRRPSHRPGESGPTPHSLERKAHARFH